MTYSFTDWRQLTIDGQSYPEAFDAGELTHLPPIPPYQWQEARMGEWSLRVSLTADVEFSDDLHRIEVRSPEGQCVFSGDAYWVSSGHSAVGSVMVHEHRFEGYGKPRRAELEGGGK